MLIKISSTPTQPIKSRILLFIIEGPIQAFRGFHLLGVINIIKKKEIIHLDLQNFVGIYGKKKYKSLKTEYLYFGEKIMFAASS